MRGEAGASRVGGNALLGETDEEFPFARCDKVENWLAGGDLAPGSAATALTTPSSGAASVAGSRQLNCVRPDTGLGWPACHFRPG